MKLGMVHPSKYKKCENCLITVSNIRHTLCNMCYIKRKEKRKNIEKNSTIREYFMRNNDNEKRIKNLGYVDSIKYEQNIRLLTLTLEDLDRIVKKKLNFLKNG